MNQIKEFDKRLIAITKEANYDANILGKIALFIAILLGFAPFEKLSQKWWPIYLVELVLAITGTLFKMRPYVVVREGEKVYSIYQKLQGYTVCARGIYIRRLHYLGKNLLIINLHLIFGKTLIYCAAGNFYITLFFYPLSISAITYLVGAIYAAPPRKGFK